MPLSQSVRRWVVALWAVALGAAVVSMGAGSVLAAKSPKITTCHYDATLGTYSPLTVSAKSAHPKQGDYAPDTALAGKTIYAIAYTNVDGVNGYSAAGCDVFISALVEDSGDSALSAGDAVMMGRIPTSFAAPWGFTALPGTSAEITPVDCGGIDLRVVRVPGGTGSVSWYSEGYLEGVLSNIDEGALSFFDRLDGDLEDLRYNHTRSSPVDDQFVDVDVFIDC